VDQNKNLTSSFCYDIRKNNLNKFCPERGFLFIMNVEHEPINNQEGRSWRPEEARRVIMALTRDGKISSVDPKSDPKGWQLLIDVGGGKQVPAAQIKSFLGRALSKRSKAMPLRTEAPVSVGDQEAYSNKALGSAIDSAPQQFLNSIRPLRATLNPYVEEYCKRRGIPVPPEGSLEEIQVLLMVNAEIGGVAARARAIEEQGMKLVKEQIGIRAKTAKEQMLAQELPGRIEAGKEANVLREKEWAEGIRHFTTHLTSSLSSGLFGLLGGFLAGIENSVSTLIEHHPKVAIPVGAGLGMFTFQLLYYSGPYTSEVLKNFALKSGLAVIIATLTTAVGAGVVAGIDRKLKSRQS